MLIVAIFGPLLLAVLVALAQHAFYRSLVRSGRMQDENAPFFGILLFRGFLIALVVVLIVTLYLKSEIPQIEDDPLWSPEQREALIEEKYGPGDGPDTPAKPTIEGAQDRELEALMDDDPPAQQGVQAPSSTPPAETP